MKIYRVMTGYETDFYGNTTNVEKAEYFFNKDEAMELYKKGEFEWDGRILNHNRIEEIEVK